VLDRLIDARLLIAKDGTIELAHECVIDDWPSLPIKTWLIQDAADRVLLDRLRRRTGEEVLPDSLLAQAEEMLQRDDRLGHEEPDVVALVKRSRQTKEAGESRHRRILIAAVAAAIVFAAVAVFAGLQRTRAEQQTAVAKQQRDRAERRFNDVRTLAHTFIFDFHDAIEKLPGSLLARELLVKTALEYLGSLTQEASDNRPLKLELAASYLKIGDIQAVMWERAAALESYRQVLQIFEALAEAEPINASHRESLAFS
jgi:hypothetical protein